MRGRIAPSSAAFLVVVVLIGFGAGLRIWGPINPGIFTAVHGSGVVDRQYLSGSNDPDNQSGAVALDPTLREVTLTLANDSRSAVTIERLRVARAVPQAGEEVSTGRLPTFVSATVTVEAEHGKSPVADPKGHLSRRLAAGATIDIRVRVAVAACDSDEFPGIDNSGRYAVVADLRTTSGRVKTVGAQHTITTSDPSCGLLPPLDQVPGQTLGEQPANPVAARLQIAQAYAIAYDFSQPDEVRTAMIDDPRSLDATVRQAAGGNFGSLVLQAGAQVQAVSFSAPDRAVVAYDLVVSGSPTHRKGTARLVDGTWRVSRSTICADLELAKVHCPPVN